MSEGVLVGIDGGGSKTLVAMADATGQVIELARGRATSPLERDNWGEALAEQVRDVAARADLIAVGAALPAYGEVEAVSAAQERVIGELFGAVPARVLNDVDAAHIGAFGGGPGILILAGTGSMAWARDDAGVSHRTGGWGEIVGDEGSGYWLGKQVLGAVSKAIDGRGGQTGMVAGVFNLLRLDLADKVNELEGWASRLDEPRTQIASLARVALSHAEDGDMVARTIADAAADELAWHVRTLERKLAAPSMAWSYAGGLFQSAVLREAVVARIGRQPRLPLLPPIGGALLSAAQHIGLTITDEFVARMASSLSTAPMQFQDAQ
jgi:N-acetylglucosamine kinase-like BadF-type ATPase